MELKAAKGELLLALIFVGLGLLWIVQSLALPMWEGFAPQSGFLPLIYGVLLAGFSLLVGVRLLAGVEASGNDEELRKPLTVLAALAATVVAIDFLGFSLPIFAMLLFLYAVVERLSPIVSVVASLAITAALFVVFKIWLGVPLPAGPWGF